MNELPESMRPLTLETDSLKDGSSIYATMREVNRRNLELLDRSRKSGRLLLSQGDSEVLHQLNLHLLDQKQMMASTAGRVVPPLPPLTALASPPTPRCWSPRLSSGREILDEPVKSNGSGTRLSTSARGGEKNAGGGTPVVSPREARQLQKSPRARPVSSPRKQADEIEIPVDMIRLADTVMDAAAGPASLNSASALGLQAALLLQGSNSGGFGNSGSATGGKINRSGAVVPTVAPQWSRHNEVEVLELEEVAIRLKRCYLAVKSRMLELRRDEVRRQLTALGSSCGGDMLDSAVDAAAHRAAKIWDNRRRSDGSDTARSHYGICAPRRGSIPSNRDLHEQSNDAASNAREDPRRSGGEVEASVDPASNSNFSDQSGSRSSASEHSRRAEQVAQPSCTVKRGVLKPLPRSTSRLERRTSQERQCSRPQALLLAEDTGSARRPTQPTSMTVARESSRGAADANSKQGPEGSVTPVLDARFNRVCSEVCRRYLISADSSDIPARDCVVRRIFRDPEILLISHIFSSAECATICSLIEVSLAQRRAASDRGSGNGFDGSAEPRLPNQNSQDTLLSWRQTMHPQQQSAKPLWQAVVPRALLEPFDMSSNPLRTAVNRLRAIGQVNGACVSHALLEMLPVGPCWPHDLCSTSHDVISFWDTFFHPAATCFIVFLTCTGSQFDFFNLGFGAVPLEGVALHFTQMSPKRLEDLQPLERPDKHILAWNNIGSSDATNGQHPNNRHTDHPEAGDSSTSAGPVCRFVLYAAFEAALPSKGHSFGQHHPTTTQLIET